MLRRVRRLSAAVAGQPARRAPIVITSQAKARPYRAYHAANLRLVDEVFDQVLAVSERTRQVLIDHGLPASKVGVSYIGTSHHAAFAQARPRLSVREDLHLAFLGYMRADKGFYFLLESLFALPDDVARRLRITIAAPVGESYPIDRLKGVAHRFREVVVHDGYRQAGLAKLLADVDLGVIPVLWEDNLPQVAIEFVAHGVPILTSDRGGAQEIGRAPDFVFRAGSTRDFCAKLTALATGAVPLARYWAAPPRIFSMEAHLQDLMRFYARPAGKPASAAPSQPRSEIGGFAEATA
jgi:glycosyltransferase involved in cell wall biosynthesis